MDTQDISQDELDRLNAEFWNEPCGTKLAQRTGTAHDFEAYDREYFKLYPFLTDYLDKFKGRVLEVGIGYGTVAAYLSKRCYYEGMDIAEGPLNILEMRGIEPWRIWCANVLDIIWAGNIFDGVVSIGCLHHTGNIPRALAEIHRVLKPDGRALIMLYNDEAEKLAVDRNTKGEQAPHIEYTNVNKLPELFKAFTWWRYDLQNGNQKDIYIEAVK